MAEPKRVIWRKSQGFVLEWHLTQYVGIFPARTIYLKHITLSAFGVLALSPGFEWDGPSGPTLATDATMRASALHDALYSLISDGLVHRSARARADAVLRDAMLEDGAGWIRAWYFWLCVRIVGWLYV